MMLELSGDRVAASLGYAEAADALQATLTAGFDPENEVPRASIPAAQGELLVMSSVAGGAPVVKLVTVGGHPRIQGVCVVFDPRTLAPQAMLDGIALTVLRTAALSALVARRLASPEPRRLIVFGAGPQGRAHAEAIPALLPTIDEVVVVGRGQAAPVEEADVICCCTTAESPLFDGERVAAGTTVIAIGSHRPGAAELDAGLMRRAEVYVESRTSALREAGEVIDAELGPGDITPLTEPWTVDLDRPNVFKSTGMAWEDAAVAVAVVERCVA